MVKKAVEEQLEEVTQESEVIQNLAKRIEKIEDKVDPQYTDSQAFVNRGMHPNQIA